MTRERAKQLEANGVLTAWREGRKIEWRIECTNWMLLEDIATDPDFHDPQIEFRVAPEPKLRPWKVEEVPVGAQVRYTGNREFVRMLITCNMDPHLLGEGLRWTCAELCKKMEHSLDGGKTWLPCGVLEGVE